MREALSTSDRIALYGATFTNALGRGSQLILLPALKQALRLELDDAEEARLMEPPDGILVEYESRCGRYAFAAIRKESHAAYALAIHDKAGDPAPTVCEIALREAGAKSLVSIHYASLAPRIPMMEGPPSWFRSVVRRLERRLPYSGINSCLYDSGTPVSDRPWFVRSQEDLYALRRALHDPSRILPVLVLGESLPPSLRENRERGYRPDLPARIVARDVCGTYHVVMLSREMNEPWKQLVGESLAVPYGRQRLYRPGVDLLGSPSRSWQYYQFADAPPRQSLLAELSRAMVRSSLAWSGFPTAARGTLGIREIERLHRQEEAKARNDIDLLEQVCDEERKEQESRLQRLEDQSKELKSANAELKEQVRRLLFRAQSAERVHREKHGKLHPWEQETPPADYGEVAAWADRVFEGRLILHPRALRGLKEAEFEDCGTVVSAVMALAVEYVDSRRGRIGKAEWTTKLESLGLEEEGSISEHQAKAMRDEYYVTYDGRRLFLERALKKGVSRDPRKCLRIYFTWLEDEQQVLIGSLPHHLENRLT